jgi:glycosyltransferase involved in cell wall biosynthesis
MANSARGIIAENAPKFRQFQAFAISRQSNGRQRSGRIMKVAFYAPLKSPNHPVPSGDRLMARQLIAALELAGHEVEMASELRSFTATSDDFLREEIINLADSEVDRLLHLWRIQPPELWFTYHTYYKTPDLIGPRIAAELGIPHVTAEASYSARQDATGWADSQQLLAKAVRQAAVNICFTERDRKGLAEAIPEGRYAILAPFIDDTLLRGATPDAPKRLVTVAMMRRGDKFDSYAMLASALGMIRDRDWTLTAIGGGPATTDVQALFSSFGKERIRWLGELSSENISAELGLGGTYVWPGCGEAYGLAYLEAQAAGLPVVAQATAGVPEVVIDGRTGLLTPEGDICAFADAIGMMLDDGTRRREMGAAARRFVQGERSLPAASKSLGVILRQYLGDDYGR